MGRKKKSKLALRTIWYDTRVTELEISQLLIAILRENQVRYIGQILNAFANESIYSFSRISEARLYDIKTALEKKGIKYTLNGMERLLADIEDSRVRRIARTRVLFDEPFPEDHIEAAYKFLHSFIKEHWPIICDYYGFITSGDYSEIVSPYFKTPMSMKMLCEKYDMSKSRVENRYNSALNVLRRFEVRTTVGILYDVDGEILADKVEAELLLSRLKNLEALTGFSVVDK